MCEYPSLTERELGIILKHFLCFSHHLYRPSFLFNVQVNIDLDNNLLSSMESDRNT